MFTKTSKVSSNKLVIFYRLSVIFRITQYSIFLITGTHKNSPIFTRSRLQPEYNSKTHYLPIFEDFYLHKPCLKKALQKHQKMSSFSMSGTQKRQVLQ